jgi:hypothetical protein
LRWSLGMLVSQCQCSKIYPKLPKTAKICQKSVQRLNFEIPPKNGLCMWISAYPFVQNDVFFKVPYILWIWDFVDMYLSHLGTRIWSPSIHNYSKKWFFGLQNSVVSLEHRGIYFFGNFEPYVLANGMEWMCKIWWTYKHTS